MSSPSASPTHPPVIWLVSDLKPGHRNQLKGLGSRLQALTGAELHWIDSTAVRVPLWRALAGVPVTISDAPKPTLIIAAGTGTHRLLLSYRRLKGAATVVLMNPAFPRSWVDAAIIPEHDGVPASRHTLITEGVINAISPQTELPSEPGALLLVGGPSPHYTWDNASVFMQINRLITLYPDWHWTVSGSRRTPPGLRAQLAGLTGPAITVVDPDHTPENWLAQQLAMSRAVWVTPDSSSMVCEAMTSGVPTGLLVLTPQRRSRVVKGNEALLERGRVIQWPHHHRVMHPQHTPPTPPWEADRAARWLIHTLALGSRR
ncbi:mitochondrial fission ELM1 family protein [Marinobacter sp. X15-166B]|uniref:mitochondrial fission ELM1 family protein n=1 Tax=Marinobacter sp. X15-166B TaxID=1897620 RepID=UPI00085BEDB0|nr:ELM1/GtrOC1 family putative glycosyltransferase [Marinobacter sp. X15-166B]OEY66598.1 hypothetical protein BG841_09120 [Marinobacter sp. X15-166B]